jgi:hypothetical protein
MVIVLAVLRHWHARPTTQPTQVSKAAQAQLPQPAKPPAVARKPEIAQPGGTDLCGVGSVSLDADDPSAAYRYVGALSKQAATRWLSALRNSDDYRARAMGLFLDGKITDGAVQSMTEPTREALVQLAVGTGDPAVYAMAVNACHSSDAADGACQQISLSAWARLDADNAVPWLLVAGAARARGDSAAEAEAFAHAAEAHKTDGYNDSLYAFAEPAIPQDVTPLERWYFAFELLGLESITREPQYTVAGQHCSAEAMQDSGVRQQCETLAELFVTHGSVLLDLAEGAVIGERAGWPIERVNGLRQERDALMQAGAQAVSAGNEQRWSCHGVELGNAFMSQRVRLGELGAAQDLLARSGDTVQDLARKHVERTQQLLRDARQREAKMPTDAAP